MEQQFETYGTAEVEEVEEEDNEEPEQPKPIENTDLSLPTFEFELPSFELPQMNLNFSL